MRVTGLTVLTAGRPPARWCCSGIPLNVAEELRADSGAAPMSEWRHSNEYPESGQPRAAGIAASLPPDAQEQKRWRADIRIVHREPWFIILLAFGPSRALS